MAYTAKTAKELRTEKGTLLEKMASENALIEAEIDDIQTLKWKQSVKCATTANGTLATAYVAGQTIDGYTLVAADRILIKDQSDQTVNGIYTVNAAGAPTRATDMDAAAEFPGAVVAVENGTTNADSAWVCTNDSVTLGSSNIVWAIFGGIKAGTNLAFSADALGVDVSGFTASQLIRLNAGGTALESAGQPVHAQNTDTGTTETTFTVDSDSTTGKLALQAAGGGNYTLTLQTPTLGAAAAITLPAVTGTLATLAGSEALTNKTKVSVTSQSAAYNDSALQAGVHGAGIADTLLVDNILVSFVNSSGTNKTSADTSSMTLYVGNSTTAAVTNNKIQSVLSSVNVGHNVYDAYAVQGHMTVSDDCGTQNANAHITGLSGKLAVSSGKTLATGWGTAGLFIVEGAGAVTQMCSVVSLVQESGCSAATDMLYINNDGTANRGLNFVGNFTKGIDFSNGTWSAGAANFCMAFGTAAAGVSVSPTDTYIPIQVRISQAVDNVVDHVTGAAYLRVDTGAAMAGSITPLMVRTYLAHNLFDAYGAQTHLGITASMQTTNDNAHLTALSAKVTFSGSPTVTKGWVTAGLFIIEGAGTCSQMCHGVSIVEEAGSTGTQSLLHLYTDVGTTPALSFSSADGTGKTIYTNADADTAAGSIMIDINGSTKYLRFYANEA